MTTVLLSGFASWKTPSQDTLEALAAEFQIELTELDGIVRLCGNYGSESYDGRAVVFFEKADGTFFEVTGSHCSCYGLEGQWAPSPVSLAYIRQRALALKDWGDYGHPILKDYVQQLWGMG